MTKASPQRRTKRMAKKSSTASSGKSKSNGKSLTQEEQAKIVQMDRSLAQKKVQLANIELQIADWERQKRTMVNELRRGMESFNDAAKEMAEAHGIDPDNVEESWKLDLSTMSFEKEKAQP